ncbi:MAG: hypothetical protein DRQ51_00205 [Gammaproteobacteria bacterium]|nr:MAG: hypothetical protein DRQ51_00205 [Gammaproteobacteria bacterium]
MIRNFLYFLLPPTTYRKYLLKKNTHPILQKYLKSPLVDKNKTIKDLEFIVLDFETTGLDLKKDVILSFGWTLIKNNKINLGASCHYLINVKQKLKKDAVTVHQITDDKLQDGFVVEDILPKLLEVIKGRVVVAHHDIIEKTHLQKTCQKLYDYKIPVIFADTMKIEKRELDRRNIPVVANQLRLFNIRSNLSLPKYNAHSAIEDAIATAELFLAQISHMQQGFNTKLKNIL